jgi:transposase
VETEPGQEVQVDFGYVGMCRDGGGKLRKVWAFIMTLSWSRHLYVEFVFDQKMETWLTCHENAFHWFGGVPQRVVIDNLKAAVLKRELEDSVLSVPYRRLARHYGFVVSANRPRTPRHSGGVVSRINYYTPRMTGETYRQRQRRLVNEGSITGEKEVCQQNTSEEKGGDLPAAGRHVADHRPGKPTRPLTNAPSRK